MPSSKRTTMERSTPSPNLDRCRHSHHGRPLHRHDSIPSAPTSAVYGGATAAADATSLVFPLPFDSAVSPLDSFSLRSTGPSTTTAGSNSLEILPKHQVFDEKEEILRERIHRKSFQVMKLALERGTPVHFSSSSSSHQPHPNMYTPCSSRTGTTPTPNPSIHSHNNNTSKSSSMKMKGNNSPRRNEDRPLPHHIYDHPHNYHYNNGGEEEEGGRGRASQRNASLPFSIPPQVQPPTKSVPTTNSSFFPFTATTTTTTNNSGVMPSPFSSSYSSFSMKSTDKGEDVVAGAAEERRRSFPCPGAPSHFPREGGRGDKVVVDEGEKGNRNIRERHGSIDVPVRSERWSREKGGVGGGGGGNGWEKRGSSAEVGEGKWGFHARSSSSSLPPSQHTTTTTSTAGGGGGVFTTSVENTHTLSFPKHTMSHPQNPSGHPPPPPTSPPSSFIPHPSMYTENNAQGISCPNKEGGREGKTSLSASRSASGGRLLSFVQRHSWIDAYAPLHPSGPGGKHLPETIPQKQRAEQKHYYSDGEADDDGQHSPHPDAHPDQAAPSSSRFYEPQIRPAYPRLSVPSLPPPPTPLSSAPNDIHFPSSSSSSATVARPVSIVEKSAVTATTATANTGVAAAPAASSSALKMTGTTAKTPAASPPSCSSSSVSPSPSVIDYSGKGGPPLAYAPTSAPIPHARSSPRTTAGESTTTTTVNSANKYADEVFSSAHRFLQPKEAMKWREETKRRIMEEVQALTAKKREEINSQSHSYPLWLDRNTTNRNDGDEAKNQNTSINTNKFPPHSYFHDPEENWKEWNETRKGRRKGGVTEEDYTREVPPSFLPTRVSAASFLSRPSSAKNMTRCRPALTTEDREEEEERERRRERAQVAGRSAPPLSSSSSSCGSYMEDQRDNNNGNRSSLSTPVLLYTSSPNDQRDFYENTSDTASVLSPSSFPSSLVMKELPEREEEEVVVEGKRRLNQPHDVNTITGIATTRRTEGGANKDEVEEAAQHDGETLPTAAGTAIASFPLSFLMLSSPPCPPPLDPPSPFSSLPSSLLLLSTCASSKERGNTFGDDFSPYPVKPLSALEHEYASSPLSPSTDAEALLKAMEGEMKAGAGGGAAPFPPPSSSSLPHLPARLPFCSSSPKERRAGREGATRYEENSTSRISHTNSVNHLHPHQHPHSNGMSSSTTPPPTSTPHPLTAAKTVRNPTTSTTSTTSSEKTSNNSGDNNKGSMDERASSNQHWEVVSISSSSASEFLRLTSDEDTEETEGEKVEGEEEAKMRNGLTEVLRKNKIVDANYHHHAAVDHHNKDQRFCQQKGGKEKERKREFRITGYRKEDERDLHRLEEGGKDMSRTTPPPLEQGEVGRDHNSTPQGRTAVMIKSGTISTTTMRRRKGERLEEENEERKKNRNAQRENRESMNEVEGTIIRWRKEKREKEEKTKAEEAIRGMEMRQTNHKKENDVEKVSKNEKEWNINTSFASSYSSIDSDALDRMRTRSRELVEMKSGRSQMKKKEETGGGDSRSSSFRGCSARNFHSDPASDWEKEEAKSPLPTPTMTIPNSFISSTSSFVVYTPPLSSSSPLFSPQLQSAKNRDILNRQEERNRNPAEIQDSKPFDEEVEEEEDSSIRRWSTRMEELDENENNDDEAFLAYMYTESHKRLQREKAILQSDDDEEEAEGRSEHTARPHPYQTEVEQPLELQEEKKQKYRKKDSQGVVEEKEHQHQYYHRYYSLHDANKNEDEEKENENQKRNYLPDHFFSNHTRRSASSTHTSSSSSIHNHSHTTTTSTNSSSSSHHQHPHSNILRQDGNISHPSPFHSVTHEEEQTFSRQKEGKDSERMRGMVNQVEEAKEKKKSNKTEHHHSPEEKKFPFIPFSNMEEKDEQDNDQSINTDEADDVVVENKDYRSSFFPLSSSISPFRSPVDGQNEKMPRRGQWREREKEKKRGTTTPAAIDDVDKGSENDEDEEGHKSGRRNNGKKNVWIEEERNSLFTSSVPVYHI